MEKNFSPIAFADIGYWPLDIGKTCYAIGRPHSLNYLKINEQNLTILMRMIGLLDGKHTLPQVQAIINSNDIVEVYQKLKDSNLIQNDPAQNPFLQSEIGLIGNQLWEFKISDNLFIHTRSLIRTVYWGLVMLMFLVIITALLLFLLYSILMPLPDLLAYQNSSWRGLLITLLFGLPVLFFHELAHCLAAIYHGLRPQSIVISSYYNVMFMWYVKTPGLYTVFPTQRLQILFAGIFMNLFLCSLSWIFLLFNIYPEISSKFLLANCFAVLSCLSPFLLSDGYFLFTTLFNMPNLRMNFIHTLIQIFSQKQAWSQLILRKQWLQFTTIKKVIFLSYMIAALYFLVMQMVVGYVWLQRIIQELVTYCNIASDLVSPILAMFVLGLLASQLFFKIKKLCHARKIR